MDAAQSTPGERFLAMGTLVTIIVSGAQTGGRYSVIEHVIPPAGGPPPHTHPHDEVFFVLEGPLAFTLAVEREPRVAETGEWIHVRPGTLHTFHNHNTHAARVLSIYTPAAGEGFFREVGQPVAGFADVPDLDRPADLSCLDMDVVLAAATRYGMAVTLPPDVDALSAREVQQGETR